MLQILCIQMVHRFHFSYEFRDNEITDAYDNDNGLYQHVWLISCMSIHLATNVSQAQYDVSYISSTLR